MDSHQKISLKLAFLCCCFILSLNQATAQLYINELMASNSTTLADESGDFDDWIEIYNAGAADVDLAGYYMSDNAANPTLWQIPATNASLTTVPAGGFLILWADKDIADGANHLNFKLSGNGEFVSLTDPDGATNIDMVTFGPQNTNVSYGRTDDGAASFQVFPQSTPGISNTEIIPSTYPATYIFQVNSNSDDAEQTPDGTMKLTSSDLELTTDGSSQQTVGLRFTEIDIPQGATITDAYLQFTSFQVTGGACNLNIAGENTANPNTFSETSFDIGNRPLTSAVVNWVPNDWPISESAGADQQSPDLTSIVQELIDRPDWSEGYAMAFIISGTGTRTAYAHDVNALVATKLIVEVALPAPTEPVVDLYINEVAARGTDYADEAGDFEDWIELYNGSAEPINIGGLFLTDDEDNLLKWQIGASTTIAPNEYQIIWTDSDPEEGPLHTNFKLSGSGGTLSLVQVLNNTATIVDSVHFGNIPFKATYGRTTDGANSWVTFGEITPDASNNGAGLWLAPPDFSLANGFYNGTQSLALSHTLPGVQIYYTTDGSDPGTSSTLYNNTITISNTQAVKAIATKSGYTHSRPGTRSYLIDTPMHLPTLFLTSDPDNFFSDESGIYVVGTNGVPGYCSNDPRNWAQDEWERPANLTLFETDGTEAFNVDVGIKIGGACSRNFALKALNVYLREKEYGDGNLNYQLFKGRSHNNYFRFKLRNSGQDFVRMGFRDGLIHSLLWDIVDLDLQGFQPTTMYLNGEYWGIHNIRENLNDEYFETNFDVKSDELDLIKSPALGWQEVKNGDDLNYMALYDFIDNNDLSQTANYDYVNQRIDMNEFINYWITMGYTANYDWPANNIIVWRERKASGKWRWAVLDTDGSTNNGLSNQAAADFNTLAQITDPNSTSWPNHSNSTLFLRGLLENTSFRDEYIQRNCSYMELVFNPDRVNHMTDSIKNMVLPEIDAHIDRWGFDNAMGGSYSNWIGWVESFKEFFQDRPDYFRGFMDDYFNLNGTYELSVIYDADTGGDVFVNSNNMAVPYDYVGTYFKDIPLQVTAVAQAGYVFSHWLETGETNPVIQFVSNSNTTLTPIFTQNSLIVNLGPDQSICIGESVSLNGAVPGCSDCSYLWENGTTNPARSITPASTNSYSITVTNTTGETASDVITIVVNDIPGASISTTDVTCEGAADGSIDLTLITGTAPYEFDWNNQATTEDLANLFPGNYTVIITDANGCSTTQGASITEPPALIFGQVDPVSHVSCFGFNDGAIDIAVAEGTPPYSFLWSNNSSSEDLNNIGPGNYTLTITEANNCQTVLSYIVNEPDEIDLSANVNDIECAGELNGSVNLSANGGTEPYTYLWSNSATSENIFDLPGGTYTVTVTDENLCTSIASYEVNEPAPLDATTSATTLTCFNDQDASIQLTVEGGTTPYTYLWNNGATTQNINNLGGGTYSVTITDMSDCEFILTDIQITAPDEIVSNISTTIINCFGDDNGAIATNAQGGAGGFSYEWNTGATTASISNLPPGTYTLTITDASDCELIESVMLTEPEDISSGALTSNIDCHDAANGSIDLTIEGGVGDYTINWSNGAFSEDIDNLEAGNYTVTITDDNDCQLIESFEITEPAILVVSPSVTALSCYGDTDASIQLAIEGGTEPYTYLWSTGATSPNLTNLGGGNFAVTITDGQGCQHVESDILIDTPTELLSNTIVNLIDCADGQNGSILTNASGGNNDYTYLWSNGATTANLFNLSPGVYSLTLTDGLGCQLEESVEITAPASLTTSFVSAPISCNGYTEAYIDLSVAGGIGPHTYIWNTGATTEDVYNLAAGFYEVTITDTNDCQLVETFTITEPDPLDDQATVIAVSCNGVNNGAIQTSAVGGTAPYSYIWSNGATSQNISDLTTGTYFLTLSDANGCQSIETYQVGEVDGLFIDFALTPITCSGANNGSLVANINGGTGIYEYLWDNGATTSSIDNLGPGIYLITVTDNGNCQATEAFEIVEPNPLVAMADIAMATCGTSNGSISLFPEGGTEPYAFVWSTGATTSSITSLSAGAYSATISDANDCTIVVDEQVSSTAGILLSSTEQATSCFGIEDGAILLTPEGGNGDYIYEWSNGAMTQNLSDVGAGVYTVTVTDTDGCNLVYTTEVMQPSQISTFGDLQDASCFDSQDGTIDLAAEGGTAPYNFLWSTGDMTSNLSDLLAGEYLLTVTDANNCTHLDTFTIIAPEQLSYELVPTSVSCFGDADGSIELTLLSGGTGPFSYSWNNGAIDQNISDLPAGIYEVMITDANECISTGSIEVIEPEALSLDATITEPGGAGNDGSISVTVMGGTDPYTYLWDDGSTTSTITGLGPGQYSVVVTDANGCTFEMTYDLQTSGLGSIEGVSDLTIFPNPSTGRFVIDIESTIYLDGNIHVYDVLGQQHFTAPAKGYQLNVAADLSQHAAGIYFIKLEVGSEVMIRKVVIGR